MYILYIHYILYILYNTYCAYCTYCTYCTYLLYSSTYIRTYKPYITYPPCTYSRPRFVVASSGVNHLSCNKGTYIYIRYTYREIQQNHIYIYMFIFVHMYIQRERERDSTKYDLQILVHLHTLMVPSGSRCWAVPQGQNDGKTRQAASGVSNWSLNR